MLNFPSVCLYNTCSLSSVSIKSSLYLSIHDPQSRQLCRSCDSRLGPCVNALTASCNLFYLIHKQRVPCGGKDGYLGTAKMCDLIGCGRWTLIRRRFLGCGPLPPCTLAPLSLLSFAKYIHHAALGIGIDEWAASHGPSATQSSAV